MDDAELIARLKKAAQKRDEFEAVMLASSAADRIEAMIAERDAAFARARVDSAFVKKTAEDIVVYKRRAEAAEAAEAALAASETKLAVAVKALETISATDTPFTIPWTHSVAADTYSKMIDHMKRATRAALAQIKGDE